VTIRAAVVAVCVSAALAGCSAEADPEPLPSAAAPSPTPVALPVPPEATPETAQGAAAFARYYLELVNRGFASVDAAAVRSVSDPGCGTCSDLIRAIEERPPAGERFEGGDYDVIFAESPPVQNGDVIVDIRYRIGELRVYGPDGKLLRSTPTQAPTDAQMRLNRRGNSWMVRGFRSVDA
jgi:hypothetical protein